MKIIKNNKKFIAGILTGAIITGGATFAANEYRASDIQYTKSGATNSITVSQALNELYENKKITSDDVKSITLNGSQTLDKYHKNLNIAVPPSTGESSYWDKKVITFPSTGTLCEFDLGYVPSFIFIKSELSTMTIYHWSNDLMKTVFAINTKSRTLIESHAYTLEGTKIKLNASDGWHGAKLNVYAIK